ncbi:alpha/beta fold hydrolase [Propioniciclava tarda]|uniref:Alpha/beta fold hydrolase n=1 Tax=Propioniciclava tarda TaxID=433330 RepID=A0A4Q9KKT9_PROTD|nr:alpha/beta hydrolase [Propioniciclava tarda]TBT95116.1 alpha/beta fold hydrolase [Propioniciclava tarda]SMO56523.1 Pimeloyl-ACP methyl ester carboxylesterase [Propioniciclava tarda]
MRSPKRSSKRRWSPRRAALIVVIALAAAQVLSWFPDHPQVGHFRTAADRAAYEAAYSQALTRMPRPTLTIDVQTSFGVVRVYQWNNPDAPAIPVVLLPGRGSGVPMWSENLPSLLSRRTVYAMDALGDAGLSAQTVPLTSAADQALWIDDALAGLGITRAHIVGHSFGAASAASLAVHRPSRVASLTLLEPAFVLNWPPISTLAWSVPATLPFLPQSWRDAAVAKVAGEDPGALDPNDPIARMITLGSTGYSAQLPTPNPLSESQLRGLAMPVYVAIAEASTITNGADSVDKANLIPAVETTIWPNTTHSLPMQAPELLAVELADFWARHDS